MSHDFLSFLIAWVAAPSRIGSFAPSGGALANAMTREMTVATGPVIDLGPGTGAFTYKT